MEALKRIGLSVSCLVFAFLASVGLEWCVTKHRSIYQSEEFWDKMANMWLFVGVSVSFVAMAVLIIIAIAALFTSSITAKEKLKKVFE